MDKGNSIDWILETGAKVQSLLTKGPLNHYQLKKTPEQHFSDIQSNIELAISKKVACKIVLNLLVSPLL